MNQLTVEIAEETIQLEWNDNNYSNFMVFQNGISISPVIEKSNLALGYKLELPSKKEIFVIVTKSHGLEVWYQGKECYSNTESGTVDYFNRASTGLIGAGILLSLTFSVSFYTISKGARREIVNTNIGGIINPVFFSLLFIIIGIWGKRSYNKAAFWVGFGLCLLRILSGIFFGGINWITIVLFLILAYYCYKAANSTPPKYRIRKKGAMGNGPLDEVF